jgi:hypothetical protein
VEKPASGFPGASIDATRLICREDAGRLMQIKPHGDNPPRLPMDRESARRVTALTQPFAVAAALSSRG